MCLSRARIASACWLISGGAALPWQVVLRVLPGVAGCQKYGGDNIILEANKLTPLAFLEFSANFNDTSSITWGFFLSIAKHKLGGTQLWISGLGCFLDGQLERLVFFCKRDWFQN